MTSIILAVAAYSLVQLLGSRLEPIFIKFELARDREEADRVLRRWKGTKRTGWALSALLVDLFVFIPTYSGLAFSLATRISGATGGKELENTLLWLILLTLLAAVGNFFQDVLLLAAVITGRARGVFIWRGLGWLKLVVAVFWTIVFFLWVMRWCYEKLDANLDTDPRITISVMILLTLSVALLFARQATALSRNKPTLLSFLLAPNRIAAKDVLERWGSSGRKRAMLALVLDVVLAVLYGLTLAIIFEELRKGQTPGMAAAAEWGKKFVIFAAALHLAQNLGALIAVYLRAAGWWIGTMRRVGWARLAILGAVGIYFVLLVLSAEFVAMRDLAMQLKEFIGEQILEL